jgi:two-component system, sensor histidine kinase and response regulator
MLEDRTSDAALINFELTEAGLNFTQLWVVNEEEFLLALEEFSPDLILADYDLPQYNGALALAEAKKRSPEVPFILITGALDKDPKRIGEILARGASDYVLKDHLDQLAPAIHCALGSGRGVQSGPCQ